MTRTRIIAAVSVLVVAIAGAALLITRPEASYDRAFDASVSKPAYHANGPVVLYDEAHRNTHTTKSGWLRQPAAGTQHHALAFASPIAFDASCCRDGRRGLAISL